MAQQLTSAALAEDAELVPSTPVWFETILKDALKN